MFWFQIIDVLGLVQKQPIKQTMCYLLNSEAWFCILGERPMSPYTNTPTLFILFRIINYNDILIFIFKLNTEIALFALTLMLMPDRQNKQILKMLFSNKITSQQHSRSRTPQKTPNRVMNTPRQSKRQAFKSQTLPKQKIKMNEQPGIKYKTKDSFEILQALEDIYSQLNFNEYDVFPLDKIDKAKKNIQNLLTFLGDEPICRNHKDLLNLYCDNDKEVICVSCVYKVNQHKNHRVRSLQNVQKALDLETIRNEEKTKSLIHQLNELKDEIDFMTKQIEQSYMMISKFTLNIIDESIKELTSMKVDMEKKLSLAYRRTNTVINRYNQALDSIVNHLDFSMQKTVVMNKLSKHLLLKELTIQHELIEGLVNKFNQNKILMEQWKKSNQDFQKVVVRKSNNLNTRVDSFIVTQF